LYNEELQIDSVSQGIEAYFNHFRPEESNSAEIYTKIAADIQKSFEKKYDQFWHVIVGDNFGSFVTHENKTFIFYEIEGLSILIFKTA